MEVKYNLSVAAYGVHICFPLKTWDDKGGD